MFENHKKVSFNIASEASYVYILSRQKFIKNAKSSQFGEFVTTWSLRSDIVTRQANFKMTKTGGNAHIEKFILDIFR